MKKIIAVLMILALCSTSVFAVPASLAASLDSPVPVGRSEAISGFSFDDDLFADVQAVALTDEEAAAVEGEGASGAISGVILGAGAGATIGTVVGGIIGTITNNSNGASVGAAVGTVAGAIAGGIIGGIFGP